MKQDKTELNYSATRQTTHIERILRTSMLLLIGILGSSSFKCSNAFYRSLTTTNSRSYGVFNHARRSTSGRIIISPLTSQFMVASEIPTTNNRNKSTKTKAILDPLIVCGPSGVGKGTIISRYMEEFKGQDYFGFTTSHTTRAPREGEINSVHYHFTTMEDIKQRINNEEFLEYATVHGNIYGTSFSSLQDVYETTGKRCLLDIDIQGVERVRTIAENQQNQQDSSTNNNNAQFSFLLQPKYIFIAPPSLELLKERLVQRGTESDESIERRTANAQKEVEYGLQEGNFDRIIINDDLDEACLTFAKTIQELYNL